MSREVEERVVQMSFENGQFEKAAKESMHTVNELKKATNFANTAKAIASSGMTEAIERVSSAFSSFGGVLKRKVFETLANDIINGSRKLFNELEIEPIQQGFSEYELKMGSVQTIMASTGESLDTVNGYLDELNTYADRTIYSFSDMTASIGKFTNAGVSLDDAVAAIQGISNEAALSGANANEASRAMYNFAQALSSGKVQLIDWKSIENANMATVEFKNELIKTAEELGTVKKTQDGMWVSTVQGGKNAFNATSNFNNVLQDAWLTSDVLIKTLAKYSDETTDLGKRAYAASQDVKTFTQLMDTLKEASGSGWSQTWEIIFGNFEEAKDLWTSVNNVIGKMIDNQSKSRNAMLQQWKDLGGRTLLIEGLADAFHVLQGFVVAVKEGFAEFFPTLTGEKLFSWTQSFHDFIKNLRESLPYLYEHGETIEGTGDQVYKTDRKYFKFSGTLEKVYRIFSGLGAVFSIVIKGLSSIAGLFFDLVTWAVPAVSGGVLGWLAGIGDWLVSIRDSMENTGYFTNWRQKIVEAVSPVGEKITALGTKFSEFFSSIGAWFKESGIKDKVISGFQEFGNDFISAIPLIIGGITDFVSGVIDFVNTNETIQGIIKKIQNLISDIVDAAPTLYQGVVDFIKGLLGFGDDSETLSARFSKLATSISDFVKELLGYDENGASILDRFLNDMFPAMKEATESSEGEVTNPILSFVDKIKSIIGDVKAAFINIGTTIGDAIEWVFGKLEEYDIEGILTKVFAFWGGTKFFGLLGSFTKLNGALASGIGGFGTIFEAIVRNLDLTGQGARGVFDSITGVFSHFWDNLTGISNNWTDIFRKKDTPATALLKIAGAIGILVAAVYILTKIDTESFIEAAKKLGLLAAGLLVFTAIFNQLSKGFAFQNLGTQLAAMAVGIIILIGAIAILGHMKLETLFQGITFLGAILVELAVFLRLAKGGGFANDTSTRFISLAISLILITQVLKQLAKMDFEDLAKAVIGLGAVLLELAIFTRLAKLGEGQKLGGYLGLAIGLLAILQVIKSIAKMDPEKFVIGLVGLGAVLLELGIFSRLASKSFKFGTGFAFLGLALSLMAFVLAMKMIAKMDLMSIVKGLTVVSIMLLEFTLVSRLMGNGVGILNSIGMLIAMVGSIAIFFEVLQLLKDYPPKQMLAVGASFAGVMGGLAAVMFVLGKMPVSATVMALANLGIIVAAIAGVGVALAALDDFAGGAVSNGLVAGKDMLQKLGEAVGAFFGGLLGGFSDALFSSLPSMGTSLGDFMTNAKPFFEGCKNIDEGTITGIGAVVGAVAAITAVEFMNGITRLLNFGESSIATFATDIQTLGDGIAKFSTLVEDVKTDKVTAAANAAKVLAEVNKELPPTGGKLQQWLGQKNLGTFSVGLIELGIAIKLFAALTNTVDADKVTAVGNAAQVLATLNSNLPPTDGYLQQWLGNKDLSKFAKALPELGLGIAAMALSLHFISDEDLTKATTAAAMLGTFAGALPEASLFDIFGKDEYTKFAEGLPAVGTAIGDFAKALSKTEATDAEIDRATHAAETLSAFAENLPDQSLLDYLFGSNLEAFGTGIGKLGEGLGTFNKETKGIESTDIDKATSAAKLINEFAKTDLQGRTFGQVMAQWVTGQNEMESFGSGMSAFGDGLSQLYSAASAVENWDVVTNAVTQLQAVSDMVKELSEGSMTNFEFAGEAFASWDQVGLQDFLSGLSDFGMAPFEAGSSFADLVKQAAIEGLSELPDIFKNVGMSAGDELVNSVRDVGSIMYTIGQDIGWNAVDGFLSANFYSAGLDAGEGLVEGLKGSMSSALNAGARLAAAALNGARTALDSHSPSRKFMELGNYSGQGFAMGMDQWNNAAVTAGEGLGKSALEGAKSTMAYLYSILNSSMDLQPVIRPVIDTTGVLFGAAQIGNILGTSGVSFRGFSATAVPAIGSFGRFDNSEALARSNSGVIEAVNNLGSRVDALGVQISNLKMVTDTGVLAGEMREHIDTELGVMAFRKGRRN